jgi:hypothetical protein
MWPQLVIFVVSLALSYLLAPKPPNLNIKAAKLDDFDAPTASESRSIPVLFGRRRLSGPNVVWYGDLRVRAIRK